MTSVFFSRSSAVSRGVRGAVVAGAVAGALVLSGCSDDGGSDDGAPATPSGATSDADGGSPSGSASASPSGSASASASGELEGSWLGTTDGKAVALVVTGEQAALFATGGTVCSGTAGEEEGMRMIHLKCTRGKNERTTGMVDSVDANSLKVTWEGGVGQETFTKAEGGQWPSGLPTAGLGS
ncbi:hypothetical protein [Streptomyces sp. A012304]|uniref:hypothetical protein n=1 Tax=Streptomyces sp. A012304 TaxID=375446 RepID=UPI00223281C6|nr:hypothetical protein [Streptomyces sp. A012304]GKQ37315.1 hypothetical protein ALMP_38530 [Streptomyces sp. A012304]